MVRLITDPVYVFIFLCRFDISPQNLKGKDISQQASVDKLMHMVSSTLTLSNPDGYSYSRDIHSSLITRHSYDNPDNPLKTL